MSSSFFIALGLSLLAGLSTGIGGALVAFTKHTSTKLLSVGLGFSAGIMIYVSFVELFSEAQQLLVAALGKQEGAWLAVGLFFLGVLITALIDKLIPSCENPHEAHRVEESNQKSPQHHCPKLMRTGVFLAVVITIHNIPEGLATFVASLQDLRLGIPITFAVALHNIPEGIAVALPIYFATRSRRKAFGYSLLSGLTEPLGAVLAAAVFFPFLGNLTLGVLFAAMAGIMVFVSLDELLPAAREYGEAHLAMYGLIAGMAVMAISLLLL